MYTLSVFRLSNNFTTKIMYIGGAISHAKGAFSSWWSNLLVSPDPISKGIEAVGESEPNSQTSEKDEDTCKNQKYNIPNNTNNDNVASSKFSNNIDFANTDEASDSKIKSEVKSHCSGEIHTV